MLMNMFLLLFLFMFLLLFVCQLIFDYVLVSVLKKLFVETFKMKKYSSREHFLRDTTNQGLP